MNGELFYGVGAEPKGTVKEAVISPKRISIDWNEGDIVGHLDATSRDGEHFSGHYGYTKPNPDLEFDLTLFRNKTEVLLVGTWCEHDTGDEGTWFFRLTAEQSRATSKGRKRAKS
jgi:hypothetical protein